MANPAPTLGQLRGPLVNSDGTATPDFTRKLQQWESKLSYTINQLGQITGNTQIAGRTEGVGTTLQNVDSGGVITANGIDFARSYLHKILDNIADGTVYARVVVGALTANQVDFAKAGVINKITDNLTDGTGSPLAGGKTAYAALVASAPTTGQTIRFNGSNWLPVAIAQSLANASHQWLNSYNAATGAFTQSQPAFADISGTVANSQLPAASVPLSGTSAGLGGSAMTVGQRITATVTVTGATTGMVPMCSPTADPGPGFIWSAFVSSANTVTVCLTAVLAGTPTATTYAVRILQ
jgi:hypothetical protein